MGIENTVPSVVFSMPFALAATYAPFVRFDQIADHSHLKAGIQVFGIQSDDEHWRLMDLL